MFLSLLVDVAHFQISIVIFNAKEIKYKCKWWKRVWNLWQTLKLFKSVCFYV